MQTTSEHRYFRTGSPVLWENFPSPRAFHTDRREHGRRSDTETPVWKRVFDIGLILIVLPVVLALAVLVYCWIKAVSPGPALFRQTRIGRGGEPFTIYKFRSMKLMAATCPHEDHVEQLIKSNQPMTKLDLSGDPRVISGCRLLRMSGLDELPQLINVLRGEMSIVGPRPCTPNEFSLYEKWQLRRFSLQPGLTGLWQIQRTHKTTFREMVAMDDQYVDGLSLALDLRIVLETPAAMLRQIGALRSVRPRVCGCGMSANHRAG
jgi:exopolysaccharide production protein ExoY